MRVKVDVEVEVRVEWIWKAELYGWRAIWSEEGEHGGLGCVLYLACIGTRAREQLPARLETRGSKEGRPR